eukprot:Nk52_evm15s2377 gene=Nk52_evmTU15s2377
MNFQLSSIVVPVIFWILLGSLLSVALCGPVPEPVGIGLAEDGGFKFPYPNSDNHPEEKKILPGTEMPYSLGMDDGVETIEKIGYVKVDVSSKRIIAFSDENCRNRIDSPDVFFPLTSTKDSAVLGQCYTYANSDKKILYMYQCRSELYGMERGHVSQPDIAHSPIQPNENSLRVRCLYWGYPGESSTSRSLCDLTETGHNSATPLVRDYFHNGDNAAKLYAAGEGECVKVKRLTVSKKVGHN